MRVQQERANMQRNPGQQAQQTKKYTRHEISGMACKKWVANYPRLRQISKASYGAAPIPHLKPDLQHQPGLVSREVFRLKSSR